MKESGSSNYRMKNYNALVFFVSVGVLLNIVSIIFFKIKMARDFDTSVQAIRDQSDEVFKRFAVDTLSRIDAFVETNIVNRSFSDDLPSPLKDDKPFYEVVERQFSYFYFIDNGVAYVDLCGDYYCVGDTFPRGGTITAISRDSILIDNKYLFLNSNRSTGLLAASERKPITLDKKHVDAEALRWRN